MTEHKTITTPRKALSHAVGAALLGFALIGAIEPASAQAPATVKTYDIPAQPLEDALNRFARNAGVLLSFDPALTAGARAPSLSGEYTVSDGFAGLLAGTGLEAVPAAGGGYTLRRMAKGEPAAATELSKVKVLASAEQTLKQAPGVSVITEGDIEKRPPVNDLSEIIRTMPGVNLTGNSASGIRGNDRQIDIRGMGPENTLILVDGKPVSSRNSVRYGWRGERDTRGDTNWVPVEEVERIEVLRGPAAARYGSGAAGGVVNIITKRPTEKLGGSLTLYTNLPEHSEEGVTRRANFRLSGPLTDALSFRVYGSANKTDSDSPNINADNTVGSLGAGREGVRNRDINGMLSWQLTPDQRLDLEGAFSRQGNIYTGDTQTGAANSSPLLKELSDRGAETNTLYRQTFGINHEGTWDFGVSKFGLQYERTRNNRLMEGLAGGGEGNINSLDFATIELKSYTATGQLDIPVSLGFEQILTLGAEWNKQSLYDAVSTRATFTPGPNNSNLGIPGSNRDPQFSSTIASVYLEDNIEITDKLLLTPGLRLDHHNRFGNNWSPSLNASYEILPALTVKGGIARAFKAPNLYQSNPGYLLNTAGNGCPSGFGSATQGGIPGLTNGACYLLGVEDLDPEVSINKEIGINYTNDGWNAGLTYFRNDYKDKIVAAMVPLANANPACNYYPGIALGDIDGPNCAGFGWITPWTNATDAVVEGIEGNLLIPISASLSWSNNLTYMIDNTDTDTGQPLSVIPEYTINSTLDWQANADLSLRLTATFYGKQEPRTLTATNRPSTGDQLQERSPYNIWGVSANYRLNENLRFSAGVSNLFDKRLFREGSGLSAGAATYNEPGRSLFASVTASF